MNKFSIVVLIALASIIRLNAQPILNWKISFGGTGTEEIKSSVYDNNGNAYILGTFNGAVDFDPGVGNTTLTSTVNQNDLFIAVYNYLGGLVWVKQIASTVEIIPREIKIDNWGGVVYCGSFKGTVDFDPSTNGTVNKTSKGLYDCFIARLKSDGNYDYNNGYATTLGGTGNDMASGFSLVNNNQQIFFAGTFEGTVVVSGFQGATDTIQSGGSKGIFIQKLNGNSGGAQFTGVIQGTNAITCESVFTTERQQVFISGKFNTTVDFNMSSSATFNLSSGSFATNTYIASYTYPNFNLKFAKNLGADISIQSMEAMKFNGLNFAKYSIYVGGSFTNTADFDADAGVSNLTSNGLRDAFIAKYDTIGRLLFVKGFGGAFDDVASDIALDLDSNIFVTGVFEGNNVNFNPQTTSNILSSAGAKDAYFAKFRNSGNLDFANKLGGLLNDGGLSILARYNTFLITGNFSSSNVDFDFSTTVNSASSNGGTDIFCAEYKICEGLIDQNVDAFPIYLQSAFTSPGASYQWLDCGNNFSTISGFNSSFFQPLNSQELQNGPYAVEISYLGCVDTSFCINNISVSIDESYEDNIIVFPNPTNNLLNIKLKNAEQREFDIMLINYAGQSVFTGTLSNENNTINTSKFSNGIYFLKIYSNDNIFTKKIIVSN